MFPLDEIRNLTAIRPGTKLKVQTLVEDFYFTGQLPATAESEIFSSDIYVRFIGGTVRTFKPKTPFNIYVCFDYNLKLCNNRFLFLKVSKLTTNMPIQSQLYFMRWLIKLTGNGRNLQNAKLIALDYVGLGY